MSKANRDDRKRKNPDAVRALADVAKYTRPFLERALASKETLVLCEGLRTEQLSCETPFEGDA
jgi:hypothetical protein